MGREVPGCPAASNMPLLLANRSRRAVLDISLGPLALGANGRSGLSVGFSHEERKGSGSSALGLGDLGDQFRTGHHGLALAFLLFEDGRSRSEDVVFADVAIIAAGESFQSSSSVASGGPVPQVLVGTGSGHFNQFLKVVGEHQRGLFVRRLHVASSFLGEFAELETHYFGVSLDVF